VGEWGAVIARSARCIRSQITFLYYHELEPIDRFYRDVMGLELVEDQRWAKIYSIGRSAFLGIVSGEKGFHRPRDENAVLVTLIVDDVFAWYDYLQERGVELLTEVKEVEEIQVRVFFLQDPGGYTLEIQQFLNPEVAAVFE
jgi:catechol 2,3-dioxygenase-like lactoylglutathione lyase family enzyme